MIPAFLPAYSDLDMFHDSFVPNKAVVPLVVFTCSTVLSSIHDAAVFRMEYNERVSLENTKALTSGFVINGLFGSSKNLQNAAQILFILRNSLDVAEFSKRVTLAWHNLFVVWVSIPEVPITASQTEWEIQYNQAMWKLSALYKELIPFVTALWNLSIRYCLLLKAFKVSPAEAIQTLPINLGVLSKQGSLVEGLKNHEALTQKILKLCDVSMPAKEWIKQVEEALTRADGAYTTGREVAVEVVRTLGFIMNDFLCRGAVTWQTTFGELPKRASL